MGEDTPPTELDITIRAKFRAIHDREQIIVQLRDELADLIVERWSAQHVEIVITPAVQHSVVEPKKRRPLFGWAKSLKK